MTELMIRDLIYKITEIIALKIDDEIQSNSDSDLTNGLLKAKHIIEEFKKEVDSK
ncbi:hypothetical protein [Paenibacillus sp. M2]|uniref:hypothetical protein n=1 Tax=Paenibacillus sp. M2 TaxID=3341793 RepID=UPI003988FFE1